jgi:ketosteroid isomerase-like protein
MTPPPDPRERAVEDEIHALSVEKFRSKMEQRFDDLADLFDDDLVFVHLNGYITSKQEWMEMLRSQRFVYDRIDLKEDSVRAYGNTAVLVGKATFVVNGGSVYNLVYTEVYTRREDRWKLVNLHTCGGEW